MIIKIETKTTLMTDSEVELLPPVNDYVEVRWEDKHTAKAAVDLFFLRTWAMVVELVKSVM